jgi:hypothetical protein
MISIRKYLEAPSALEAAAPGPRPQKRIAGELAAPLVDAYRATLMEMGRSGTDACPATGAELASSLADLSGKLASGLDSASLAEADNAARCSLQDWGRRTSRHFQQKAGEVKEMLLAMARTAESVGERDQRCARQIDDVTTQLRRIASLDDVSQIRASIERSASELKTSIERLNAEGKAVLDALQAKVITFQARMEEAEQLASLDALTRLRSRLWVEGQLEQRIASAANFCVAILDIDGFKSVNDTYGHVAGDEVLRQFANARHRGQSPGTPGSRQRRVRDHAGERQRHHRYVGLGRPGHPAGRRSGKLQRQHLRRVLRPHHRPASLRG